jgi:predicted ATP-grasp superfamily ATP-dependent carboligase
LKAVADYETGPDSDIPPERSAAALETATRFVDCIAGLLGDDA